MYNDRTANQEELRAVADTMLHIYHAPYICFLNEDFVAVRCIEHVAYHM